MLTIQEIKKRRRAFENAGHVMKFYDLPASPLPSFLDKHQIAGVTHALTRSRSYLAHAPGAGKTVQAIVTALWAKGTGQCVFIVPPQLTANWARELYRFFDMAVDFEFEWPSIAVVPLSAEKQATGWGADFLIVPDSMIAKPWVLDKLTAMHKKILAVDEASRFKEHTSERTIALFGGQLKKAWGRHPGLICGARHVVLLDGSPMPNRPMELWAPIYGTAPEVIDFMDREEFGFRYCGPTMNEWNSGYEFKYSSNETELKSKLRKNFMHVVPEADLDHPERLRNLLYMSDIRSAHQKTWEKKNLSSKWKPNGEEDSKGEIARHRRELGERKVQWVSEYVSDRLRNTSESILLFAWHRSVCERLHVALKRFSPGIVMGGTPKDERERIFSRFQHGSLRLIIGNILAMGRGINLQKAHRVIFAEYSWSDETNLQAEKRASRRGSNNAFVRCNYIVCPNSLDERVLSSLFKKISMVGKII